MSVGKVLIGYCLNAKDVVVEGKGKACACDENTGDCNYCPKCGKSNYTSALADGFVSETADKPAVFDDDVLKKLLNLQNQVAGPVIYTNPLDSDSVTFRGFKCWVTKYKEVIVCVKEVSVQNTLQDSILHRVANMTNGAVGTDPTLSTTQISLEDVDDIREDLKAKLAESNFEWDSKKFGIFIRSD